MECAGEVTAGGYDKDSCRSDGTKLWSLAKTNPPTLLGSTLGLTRGLQWLEETRILHDFTVLPENQLHQHLWTGFEMYQHVSTQLLWTFVASTCDNQGEQKEPVASSSAVLHCDQTDLNHTVSETQACNPDQPRALESQVAFGREHLFESICWGLQDLSTNFPHFFPRTTEPSENFVAICCNEGWLALSCTVHEVRMKFEDVEDMPVQARTLTSCTMAMQG